MLELFARMLLQFGGDVHEFGAVEHLRVHHVSDHSLIFTGFIFVQIPN